MCGRDRRWSSCYTLSDGKHDNYLPNDLPLLWQTQVTPTVMGNTLLWKVATSLGWSAPTFVLALTQQRRLVVVAPTKSAGAVHRLCMYCWRDLVVQQRGFPSCRWNRREAQAKPISRGLQTAILPPRHISTSGIIVTTRSRRTWCITYMSSTILTRTILSQSFSIIRNLNSLFFLNAPVAGAASDRGCSGVDRCAINSENIKYY